MDVQAAYNTWSTTYDTDRNLTRDLDAEVTQRTLAPFTGRRILELGCGTGKNTAFLAGIGSSVQALDFSEGMLAQARAKVPAAHVTFTVANLTEPWPCTDGWAELAVGNLVLEHIADLHFIFREAARCLAAGGHFFLSELHPFRQYLGGQAVIRREGEETRIPASLHHISDFLDAASQAGLTLVELREWWHTDDQAAPPRLVSFLWQKAQ